MPSIPSIDESTPLLFALLPGLLAYLVHNYLTVRSDKIEPVHAVLWGLAATLLVQAIWWCAKSAGNLIPTPDVIGLPLTAIVLGTISARLTNTGSGYRFLYEIGLTRGPSQSTVWHSSLADFRQKVGEFAVFHLDDGRCYYGKICSYERRPKDSHVLIDCYVLLADCDKTFPYDPSDIRHRRQLLIRADSIKYVELVPHQTEECLKNDEPTTSKPASVVAASRAS